MDSVSLEKLSNKSFSFGSRAILRGRLHFRKTHSNIFVTLTDLSNQVIASVSGGQCFHGNKRPKKAPQALEPMMQRLALRFKEHNLTSFEIWLKSPFSWHVQVLIKELSTRNLSLISIVDKRVIAHNGVRGRKPRRV